MKWEYQIAKLNVIGGWNSNKVDFDTDVVQEFTNRLGQQGWELTSSIAITEGAGRTKDVVFVFKRPADE